MSWYSQFRPLRPISTAKGIRARSQRGGFATSWWAGRWITALEPLLDAGRLKRGQKYARAGQVLSLKWSDKGVLAQVQGSLTAPYLVRIGLRQFTDDEWTRALDALAQQALYSAQLLAGEMPPEIDQLFYTVGIRLFPAAQGDLMTDCSCPDPALLCKHVAATHFLLAEQLDEDPFLLFRLRGRSQEEVLAELRARRGEGDDDPAAAEESQEEYAPLDNLERFWSLGSPLAGFTVSVKGPAAPLAVLSRLGQPSFFEEDIKGLLGPTYEAITRAALRVGYGADLTLDEGTANG
jgi:uncharacterized Zn finger protein